jgi:23S rRNA (cytidine2498-2'-O)-methyltransferase
LREAKLPEQNFPVAPGPSGAGAYALLAPDRILYTTDYDRPDPLGEVKFAEDKSAPSRAYLKLWEAFALLGRWPEPGALCLDLGSHPGGWTWVLAKLGARVKSFDRQPLDPAVAAMPGVEFFGGDAFTATPGKIGEVDWLCSDLICYPEKLLEFVLPWIESGKAKNMICTIKMQGAPDPAVIAEFEKLGRVLHLQHNKHEITWIYSAP